MSLSAEAARILHVMLAREPELWRNERRCRALLADELPDYPTEQVALRRAMTFGIPAELATRDRTEPLSTLLARLAAALQSAEAMRADVATWAVATWASAMSVTAPGFVAPAPEPSTVSAVWLPLEQQKADSRTPRLEHVGTRPRDTRNPWPWALVAAPFIVVVLLTGVRATVAPQFELEAMWYTVTEHPVHFLAWYLPLAAAIVGVTYIVRLVRRG